MHRKIIVLSVDYDPERHDDPAGWDWATLTDQPGTTVVAAGFVGEVNDEGDISNDELNADELKAVQLVDGVEDLASFSQSCGSDDLEERLIDEVSRNNLDIDVDKIDFVKVLGYFQNN
jgi:hypothetical protein